MYLSKKVLIDRFIFQFYIDYFINFILAPIFIILLPKIPGIFPNNTIWVKIYILLLIWNVDESDVVMFTVKLTLR